MVINRVVSFGLVFFFSTIVCHAQESYGLSEESQINITGTSTLHDWEVKSTEISGNLSIDPNGKVKANKPLRGNIVAGELLVKVEAIKSERGETMNSKMHRALKYEDHPMVNFKIIEPVKIGESSEESTSISGMLTMAGEERKINVSAMVTQSDGVIFIKGKKALKLTDFGISPPTAMFGQIETGDGIVVLFDLKFME